MFNLAVKGLYLCMLLCTGSPWHVCCTEKDCFVVLEMVATADTNWHSAECPDVNSVELTGACSAWLGACMM